MPKRFHLQRPDLAHAVAVELRVCKDVGDQERLLAMRMAASGQFTSAQIAEQVGISRRQFFHWVNALKWGGVDGLLERDTVAEPRRKCAGKSWMNLWPAWNKDGGRGP